MVKTKGQAPLLSVENLSFSFPDGNRVVNNISFQVQAGEIVFFHGKNGAGKTTLFQCLTGLLKVKDGTIRFHGKPFPREKDRLKKIAIVFQNADDQIIAGSVADEVAFGPLNLRLPIEEVKQRVDWALKVMDIQELSTRPPHFLSYGQKKRVTIASILAMKPDILILDEPTSGLDQEQAEELVVTLKTLAKQGMTLLISTHETDFSYRLADRVIFIDQGSKICDGLPEEVFLNQEVINTIGVKKPVILDVYDTLCQVGVLAPGDSPKDQKDMIQLIQDLAKIEEMKN